MPRKPEPHELRAAEREANHKAVNTRCGNCDRFYRVNPVHRGGECSLLGKRVRASNDGRKCFRAHTAQSQSAELPDRRIAMPKFRKKPVVIEAVRFDGKNFDELENFVGGDAGIVAGELVIATLEGAMHASVGDWIIRGVKGEFYPVKPDIFAATYEEAADAQA